MPVFTVSGAASATIWSSSPSPRWPRPEPGCSQQWTPPVSTSAPSVIRQRSRNGLGGMGSTAKQPISSTGAIVVAPARVCASIVPARGGMI